MQIIITLNFIAHIVLLDNNDREKLYLMCKQSLFYTQKWAMVINQKIQPN